MTKQDTCFTMAEFIDMFGWECETCDNFDMENAVCLKGRRPRKYTLEDGPNEECHAIRYCLDYIKYKGEIDEENIKRSIGHALDCFTQEYC